MSKNPGDTVGHGAETEGKPGDGTAAAGDAVAIDQTSGQLSPTNSGDTGGSEELAGVATQDHGSAGDEETLVLAGRVVVSVASGATAGDRVDVSATDGELASSSGGPGLLLCDEGGTYEGASIDAGYAVIHF